jgi:hypothetical protein
MSCGISVPYYLPQTNVGITIANSDSDGSGISIGWYKAYPSPDTYVLGYNIYFSSDRNTIFSEGPKYLAVTDNLALDIFEFTPGDTFYFAVRATQFDPSWIDLTTMPLSGDSYTYSEGILLDTLYETDGYISVSDVDIFPNFGVVRVGDELIQYSNKDIPNSQLTGLTRGFLDTNIRFHQTDGYDGYYFENPLVVLWNGLEEVNEKVYSETSQWEYPNFASTSVDGYHNRSEDLLNIDNSASDQVLTETPPYDYRGWHRINPNDVLLGKCVGSYFGGERFCFDGYNGYIPLRGNSVTDINLARQEVLLSATGEPVVLVRRKHTGIHCSCYTLTHEYPDDRCPNCLATGFLIGWEQYFSPRRSDGRIMVRFDAAVDDVPFFEAGLEATYSPNCWTIGTPTIHDRDMIIRYDKYTNQEIARFEVLNVTRNVIVEQVQGAQKFAIVRVRKTDSFYKFKLFDDTSNFPSTLTTGISSVPGLILPHVHLVEISEKITSLSQIQWATLEGGANTAQMHNHQIINGIVQPAVGIGIAAHTHTLTL